MLTLVLAALAAQPLQTPPSQAMWIYLQTPADRDATGLDRLMDQCAPDPDVVRTVLATGARLRRSSCWLDAISVDATPEQLARIQQQERVRSVEPVRRGYLAPLMPPYLTNEPRNQPEPDLWALDITGITYAHSFGYTGNGVTIGVIDSGFNTEHEAFDGIQVVAERDFLQEDDDVADGPGDPAGQDHHGTQVLALLAGNQGDTFRGATPHARYVLAKTQTLHGDDADEDHFVAAVEWMAAQGVDVITTSVGFTDKDWPDNLDGKTTAATKVAGTAATHGIVFVAAAGNFGPESATLAAPADHERVIAVGAVEPTLEIAGFSSRGPTADGRIKPDLVAPGAWLWSVNPSTASEYIPVFGTSHATPLVAGAAALLVQARMEKAVVFDVRLVLRMTASHAAQPDPTHGWGLLNLQAALDWVHHNAPPENLGGCTISTHGSTQGLLGLFCLLWIRPRERRIFHSTPRKLP